MNNDWKKEYSQIMIEWIESQWKIEKAHQDGKPYTRMSFEADAHRVEKKLENFIQSLLDKQIEEICNFQVKVDEDGKKWIDVEYVLTKLKEICQK